jgi:HAD superfamily hydrolase (TIGR01509 family)
MALRLARAHILQPMRGITTLRILRAYRHGQEALRDGPVGGDLALAQLRFAADATGASPATVQETVTRWMDEAPLDLLPAAAFPGMQSFVLGLRASGLRLGVLSDYPPAAKLAALGVGDLFDAVLCAQAPEVGVFKPNPRGILVLLERLGVAPSEALYVGDRVEVDAAAARAAGVACAILSSKAGRTADGCLSVTSYAELRGVLDRHTAMTNELRGAPTQ